MKTSVAIRNTHYALPFIVLALITSCQKGDFLDSTSVTDLTEETVFADSAHVMDFLAGLYTNIGFSFRPNRFGSGGLNAACDEAEGKSTSLGNAYVQFVTGSLNAANVSAGPWNNPYTYIRRANQFLKHIGNAPFSASQRTRARGEARFLRAWYYAILLKHYGGVPLVGDTLYDVNDDILTKRNTYEECVNYIVSECDVAAQDLPAEHFSLDYGRVTRGACLALKSRVLLYAASPLFNGGSIATDPELRAVAGYPDEDPERWKKAADAAKAIIDQDFYQLYEDNETAPGYGFARVLTLRKNNELILADMFPRNRYLEALFLPPSRGGAANGAGYPTQELVDAFGMRNGLPISDPASGYDENNPYENRDPRLDYTVIRNESMILLDASHAKEPVYTYAGAAPDGFGRTNATPTGYYPNKMLDENVANTIFYYTERCLPLIRYAEILLNFAEAQNEYSGPSPEVYEAVEAIRRRAGLDPYTLPQDLGKEEMREIIRNERRVELAFEEHRFWDVRRWKIAGETDTRPVHGMQISRHEDNSYSYQRVTVRQRNFRPAMYLWPIPQSEVFKSEDLLQNPGW